MKQQICICCGEPIPPEAERLLENPNVCPSCLALASQLAERSAALGHLESNLGDKPRIRIDPG